jgi:hypothetical protein
MLRILPAGCLSASSSSRSPIVAFGAAFAALREGLAASRQYQRLRSRGIQHDPAIREAFGIGLKGPHTGRHGVGAIRFAGKI